jgi:apoptosis-inducing factor 2
MAFIPYIKSTLQKCAAPPPGLFNYPLPPYVSENAPKTPEDAFSIVRAKVAQILPGKVKLEPVSGADLKHTELDYEYLVLATGTALPPPGSLHVEGKMNGIDYFRTYQKSIKDANKIAIIGAGAIGVRK